MTLPVDWIVPEWPAPPNVRALMTTRAGGVSQGRYAGFNLGEHVGDEAAAVAANRAQLAQVLGMRPVFLRQVHGTAVLALSAQTPDGEVADACLSRDRGVACVIQVADCLPVLLCAADGSWVGAAHAGWRGLAGQGGVGVLEALAQARRGLDGCLAWLGPCIGPESFEVGAEVKAAFEAADPMAGDAFKALGSGKYLGNLPLLARQRLRRLGALAVHGNDGSRAWCTVSHPSRFFSHRRDAAVLGASGRMAACIGRV